MRYNRRSRCAVALAHPIRFHPPRFFRAVSRPSVPPLLIGVGLCAAATCFFSLLDASIRQVSAVIPLALAMWVRYIIQSGFTLALVRQHKKQWMPRSQNLGWQVARAVCFIGTSAFAYLSLRYMKLAEFTAIVLLSPVIVSAVAVGMLHEKLPPIRIALLAIALGGALLITKPGGMTFGWVLLLPMGQVVANVAFLLITAHLSHYDDSLTTHLYTGLFCLLLASLALPFFWPDGPLDYGWQNWLLLAAGAMCGSLGHLLLLHAYRFAPSTMLMPYLYLQIAFATLWGWLFFSNMPDALSMLGISLIAISGVTGAVLSWRKRAVPLPGA